MGVLRLKQCHFGRGQIGTRVIGMLESNMRLETAYGWLPDPWDDSNGQLKALARPSSHVTFCRIMLLICNVTCMHHILFTALAESAS